MKHTIEQMNSLNQEIEALSTHISDIALCVPGLGENLAPLIAAEIGGIHRFKKAKQLVAYCGVDPSVRQSGNLTGTHNKVSKGGSPYLRRALYIAATVASRKASNRSMVNPVLYDYYQEKTMFLISKVSLLTI